jgi:hypothetical protein
MTSAERDLHLAHPGQFQTDVRTSGDASRQQNTLRHSVHVDDFLQDMAIEESNSQAFSLGYRMTPLRTSSFKNQPDGKPP